MTMWSQTLFLISNIPRSRYTLIKMKPYSKVIDYSGFHETVVFNVLFVFCFEIKKRKEKMTKGGGGGGVKSKLASLKKGVGKVSGGVKKAAKIGLAAGQLAVRVKNPVNQIKFARNAIKGKGFVLPGSKYIGPGNEMNKGAPVDEADANAFQHDKDYDEYIKRGHRPRDVYTGYSDADERLLRNTKADTPNGLAVNLGMGLKKGANKLGLTKRIRDSDIPESKANKKQVAKKMVGGVSKQVNNVKNIQHVQPRIAPVGNPSGSGVQVRSVES